MIEIADLKKIGARLREAREKANVSAAVIAQHVGSDDASTVTRWEKGERQAGCRDIARAAAFLGMEPNELLLSAEQEGAEVAREELAQLGRLIDGLEKLSKLMGGVAEPVGELADFIESLNVKWARKAKAPRAKGYAPDGSVVEKAALPGLSGLPERSIEAVSPPGKPKAASARAGEAKAPYGRKKK